VFDASPTLLTALGPVRALVRRLGGPRHADARRCDDGWREVDWVSGAALLIRREIFEAIGGWCEDYWMYSEDVDLCCRARAAGHTVAFTAEATRLHRHGGTSLRNLEASGLTRSEVIMSRHVYASRHFHGVRQVGLHALLAASRLPPLLLARALCALWPGAPEPLQVRAIMARHLVPYYRGALGGGGWLSPRVRRRRSEENET